MTRKPTYRDVIETLYRKHAAGLRRTLARDFPRVCPALVHDAVNEAFTQALETSPSFHRTWQSDGARGLRALLCTVAWRHLRGHLRKKSSRHELLSATAAEPHDHRTPEHCYHEREALRRARDLIDEAAARFGATCTPALRSALLARLSGSNDTEAARAHGVPREYVNRAKHWFAAQLQAA